MHWKLYIYTIFYLPYVLQLWCAAGVNLSGGRTVLSSELSKQTKGSQCSLDQLEQENKASNLGSSVF